MWPFPAKSQRAILRDVPDVPLLQLLERGDAAADHQPHPTAGEAVTATWLPAYLLNPIP